MSLSKIYVFLIYCLMSRISSTPRWNKIPIWRGFNLLNFFDLSRGTTPFTESNFQLMNTWGFNFIRIPIDYRTYINNGSNWLDFNNTAFAELDAAIYYGINYGIHVCFCLHRIPGYSVNTNPPEKYDLWTNSSTQKVAGEHWAHFATRYKDISSDYLSFNLLNEPNNKVTVDEYVNVVDLLCRRIREISPERLIIADGLMYATKPVYELIPFKVAQSTRGYFPKELTHYQATWMSGSNLWPLPQWPFLGISAYLYTTDSLHPPIIIKPLNNSLEDNYTFKIKVHQVSRSADFRVKIDGKLVFSHDFRPGPGEGEWEKVVYNEKYHIYQNIYNREYEWGIHKGAEVISLEMTEGDWVLFNGLNLIEESGSTLSLGPDNFQWASTQPSTAVIFNESSHRFITPESLNPLKFLYDSEVKAWKELESMGVGVIVGEWGCWSHTPHVVTMDWMADVLKNYGEAGWGWALWNLEGGFGPINSHREDVNYTLIHGRLTDVKMRDLLMQYAI